MNQSVNLWQPLYCFELDSNGYYYDVTVKVCHTVEILLYCLYQITYIYAVISKQECFKLLIWQRNIE